jgi:DNA-directed RNA polymerase sigma subunit (sigma70/sigma32)
VHWDSRVAESAMSPRERQVLRRRAEDATFAEVGAELGCCAQRVAQLEADALRKARRRIVA